MHRNNASGWVEAFFCVNGQSCSILCMKSLPKSQRFELVDMSHLGTQICGQHEEGCNPWWDKCRQEGQVVCLGLCSNLWFAKWSGREQGVCPRLDASNECAATLKVKFGPCHWEMCPSIRHRSSVP